MSEHEHRPSTGAGAEGDGSDRRPAAGKVARTGKLAQAPGSTASTATPRAASVQRQAAPASHEDPFGMHLIGGPDTSTPLPTRGADTLADAHDQYLGAHWDRLRAASRHHFASHLGRWNVPRLSWAVDDTRRAQAITAAIFPSLHIAGQLEALVAPEPLAPAIALGLATQARPGEGDGDPTWNPMVGVAVSRLLERRLAESMARMGARYVAAYDAREGEVVASDLPRSDAMDGVAARLLSDELVRVMGPVPQRRRDRTPRRPKAWRWLGGQDASLWNWIEVTDPPNATLEDVALLLPADVPPIVEGDGRFFRMPEDWARNQPAAGAHAPRLGTVATGLELASSTRAVDAAIAQADDVKPQKASAAQLDARAERIAGDLHQIVSMLGDAHAERVVPAFVSLGAMQSEKHGRRADVARVLFGQEELLKEILVEIERFTHVAHARGHSRESGPVQGVLLELALAAGNSHLHDVGRQHLATARKRAAEVGRRLAEEAVAASGGGAIDLAEAGGAGADDARERQRARFDALDSSASDPVAIDVEASIDAFLLHTRAVDQQLDTMMSALLATNDRLASIIGMPWVTEAEELARAVAIVRDKARNVHVWLSERLAETHDASARRALLDRAKSALAEQIAATEIMDLSRSVASMLARVDDADRIIQLVNMTLQTLAISVVATGAGMFVTAAAAPTTALGRLGVATAGAVTEATVAGTLQTLLFNDNPGDALAENLLGSLMSIAVLRGFHKVTEQYGPFTPENIALWERLGSRADVAVLRATHLTVEMALGAGAGFAAVHIVRSPVTPTEDEGLQWAMQGASIVAGHWISRRMMDAHARMQRARARASSDALPQIEKALADIDSLRGRTDAAKDQPLEPAELRELFAEHHRVLANEAKLRGAVSGESEVAVAEPPGPRDGAVREPGPSGTTRDPDVPPRVLVADWAGDRYVTETGHLHQIRESVATDGSSERVSAIVYDPDANKAHFQFARGTQTFRVEADVPARIATSAELVGTTNRVVGTPLQSRSTGEQILRDVNQGRFESLAVLGVDVAPGLRLSEGTEFGLGEIGPGRFVVVRGQVGKVDWDQVPGVKPASHTHPTTDGNDLKARAGVDRVPLERLFEATDVPLVVRELILPSPSDVRIMARQQIDDHRVITDFVVHDDHVMNRPKDDTSPPLEWVIRSPREVGVNPDGYIVFEWTVVGEVGGKPVTRPRRVWSAEPPKVDAMDSDTPVSDYGSHYLAPPPMRPRTTRPAPERRMTRAPSLDGDRTAAEGMPDKDGSRKTRGVAEDQLSEIGRNNPSPLSAEELASIEGYQAERNAYLKKWREFDISNLPPETGALLRGKADRAIKSNMTPDDLSAVIKERRGDVILKRDGNAFDHIAEYRGARNAVVKALAAVERRIAVLEEKGAAPGELEALTAKRRELSSLLDHYETAAGGEP